MKPIEWEAIDDGYGTVGYSWTCWNCKERHTFVVPYKDEVYQCEACGVESYSDWEEE